MCAFSFWVKFSRYYIGSQRNNIPVGLLVTIGVERMFSSKAQYYCSIPSLHRGLPLATLLKHMKWNTYISTLEIR